MKASFPTVNQAAFVTITALGVATTVSTIAAATVASTVATVAYTVLALTSGAMSIASITAWVASDSSDTARAYWERVGKHAGFAIAGTFQFVSQMLLQALVQGIAEGVSKKVREKIAGPDNKVVVERR